MTLLIKLLKALLKAPTKPQTQPKAANPATVANQRLTDKSIDLLAKYEGIRNKAYKDSGGALTIGIGHLLTNSEKRSGKIIINGEAVKYRHGLSDKQVYDLFRQDIKHHEKAVNDYVKVALTPYQFGALVSFSYNVGIGAFKRSTLVRELNKGRYNEVPTQLRRWVYDNGVKVAGLVNRREHEIKQWKNQ